MGTSGVLMKDAPRGWSLLDRLWQTVKRQIITDVPEDVVMCQFDCHKGQCIQSEWERCARRIHKGAGELFPNSPPENAPNSEREALPVRIGANRAGPQRGHLRRRVSGA
jgi:hypothetical protein